MVSNISHMTEYLESFLNAFHLSVSMYINSLNWQSSYRVDTIRGAYLIDIMIGHGKVINLAAKFNWQVMEPDLNPYNQIKAAILHLAAEAF